MDPTSTASEATPAAADAAPAPAEGAQTEGAEPAAPLPPDPLEAALAATETAAPAGEGAPAAAGDTPADPAAVAAKPRVDLTARLASMSRKAREAALAAKAAEQRAAAAEQQAQSFAGLFEKVKGDPKAVKELLAKAGVDFRQVVDVYAEDEAPATPEQVAAKAIEGVKAELDALKKAREDEAKAAASRANEAKLAETLAGIQQAISKAGDKAELCARLGEEAAREVFGIVTDAWNRAGRPQLTPEDFNESVAYAIEKQELIYEERGKKLAKGAKSATPGAPAPAATTATGLPRGLVASDKAPAAGASALSEKDQEIVNGLIDKTAPAAGSQRAKPRTIGSSLGGSAPPRATTDGSQDPRDALRDVLASVA